MKGLQGKTAIVTGAAAERSIGRAIALRLAEEGVRLIVNDLHPGPVEALAAAIGRDNAVAVAGDVSKKETADVLVRAAAEHFGGVDILVNNAGITESCSLLDLSEDRWDRLLAVNLKSVYLCTRAVLPAMIDGGGGSIVNISSVAGRNGGGSFGSSHYAASKAAVIGFSRAIAKEAGPHGIRVNAVAPASIDTDMFKGQSTKEGLNPEEIRALRQRSTVLKRLAAAEEVAAAVAYLASDDASFVTGTVMDVNGGSFIG